MDDPCNASIVSSWRYSFKSSRRHFPPSYAFKMAIQSDWDEIGHVVDYRVSPVRGQVSLVGCHVEVRASALHARHGEKVESSSLLTRGV